MGTPAHDTATALLDELVAALPGGGEPREGQVEMTRLVARALATGEQVAVRAATGTGKSLAVLAAIAATGSRTVIATATKALQDQYVHKELPLVESVTPLDWAVLKGRANYACHARLAEARSVLAGEPLDDVQDSLFGADASAGNGIAGGTGAGDAPAGRTADALPGTDSGRLDAVFEWAEHTDTGDLSELPFELDWRTAQWVATGPDGCPGADKCRFSEGCFSERAMAAAKEATVVLVNTSLLGADLSLDGALLGDADAYVIDEAHEAEDILASAFGAEVHPNDLLRLERHVRVGITGADELRSSLRRSADRLERELRELDGESFRDGFPDDGELRFALVEAAQLVADVQQRARDAVKADGADARAEACRRSADRLFEAIERLGADGTADAIWVESGTTQLRRVPIDVGGRLAERAWGDRAVVLTSATLSPLLPRRLGLHADSAHHDVGSPFDHREAAWLYVPKLLGGVEPRDRTPNHPDWFDEAWAEAAAIIDAAEGRTLFLCTSMRNATAFAELARDELDWPVLVQGEQPKAKLLAEFAGDEHSVLVGTMGLWQGVDVAGPSLSCVIVDKIPFPRPDDPLWQARADHARARLVDSGVAESDAGYRSFAEVQVPRAAALLAQGSGRLIRTSTDRGLVVVLDPRLAEKAYRRQILDEMPPMRRTRSRAEAVAHLRTAFA